MQVSDREQKKLNDKQRRLQETAARNKADALRDDDNVFDVSYESQGGAGDAGDTVSATDIKVGYKSPLLRLSTWHRRPSCMLHGRPQRLFCTHAEGRAGLCDHTSWYHGHASCLHVVLSCSSVCLPVTRLEPAMLQEGSDVRQDKATGIDVASFARRCTA